MADQSFFHMVYHGGGLVRVTNSPVLTVAANYVANDYVGTNSVPMTFANCARVVGGSGYIISALLVDYALQSVSTELWLFSATVTPPLDSAAWTITDAHSALCIGVIPFTTYYASAVNSVSMGTINNPIGFVCAAASQDLYGCLVTRGAPAYASLDLTVKLGIMQN